MKKKICALVVFVFILTSLPAHAAYDNYGDKFQHIMELVDAYYYDKEAVDKDKLFNTAVNSMLNSLDPYSTYMEKKDLTEFMEVVNNEYEGIGVIIDKIDGRLTVEQVFKEAPAYEAGVKKYDVFKSVDGVDVSGMDLKQLSSLLKGPEGSKVVVEFLRGEDNELVKVEITRAKVVLEAVYLKDIKEELPEISEADASKIAYIVLETFSSDVHFELGQIVESLESAGKKDIILDLRGNSGGDVFSGVKTAEFFTEKGPVLRLKDNEGNEQKFLSAGKKGDKNIVVLVDENTASASEFVAGSIQEDGGKLVGATTYGKGIAQVIEELEDGDSVKLTVYSFYTGDGKEVHKIGIKPDYEVILPHLLPKTEKFALNYESKEVKNLEEILKFLGYGVEPDDVYDEKTMNIVKEIQSASGLYPYGVCDFTTQDILNNLSMEKFKTNDTQLKKAVEVLMEGME